MNKILIIDDSIFFRKQISTILEECDYDVVIAADGESGLEMVMSEKPDLVLLDIAMPGMDGFEVCRILRDSESNNLMPIIMLTSRDDMDDKLVGLELGADDYITKPFNSRELISRIRNTLRRIARNRQANPLTGLPGNIEIQREINSRISKEDPFAVIYVDLDNFKSFNDVYGFFMGDLAIKMTADIMMEVARLFGSGKDFVGHIGGDDYVLVTSYEKAEEVAKEFILQFDKSIRTLYTQDDLDRGFISTVNRKGDLDIFPLLSLSLAIVTNHHRSFENHLEVATVASELKKKLKQMEGSNFMIDRRKEFCTTRYTGEAAPEPAEKPAEQP